MLLLFFKISMLTMQVNRDIITICGESVLEKRMGASTDAKKMLIVACVTLPGMYKPKPSDAVKVLVCRSTHKPPILNIPDAKMNCMVGFGMPCSIKQPFVNSSKPVRIAVPYKAVFRLSIEIPTLNNITQPHMVAVA